jgi:hypothetical protein
MAAANALFKTHIGKKRGHKKSASGKWEALSRSFEEANIPLICHAWFLHDGIGTLLRGAGCQGFSGPLPSTFLDKCCKKNCCKDKSMQRHAPKIFIFS